MISSQNNWIQRITHIQDLQVRQKLREKKDYKFAKESFKQQKNYISVVRSIKLWYKKTIFEQSYCIK